MKNRKSGTRARVGFQKAQNQTDEKEIEACRV